MVAAKLLNKPVVVRELMPQEINTMSRRDAMSLARHLAGIVGRAHGRQMAPGQRRAWRSALSKNHKSSPDAPSWLWTSIVDLIALHKSAYLDHCRRCALSEAA
jgi:uncharacterized protein (DUF2252 family)